MMDALANPKYIPWTSTLPLEPVYKPRNGA